MEESKFGEVEIWLCAIGIIMCVGAMIGGIIYVILCGTGWGLIRALVMYIVGALIVVCSGIISMINTFKLEKEITEQEEDINNSWIQVSENEQENLVTGEIRFGRTERTEEDDMEKFETKIDGYWVGTVGYEIKKLFDLDIGEKFVLKYVFSNDIVCYFDKDGILINDDDETKQKYAGVDVSYGMLRILIGQCDYCIEKISQTIDKQVIKDYIEELENEIKEIDRLNSLFSLNLAVQKSLKRIVRELKELIK